jgi:asparagine synthase (glutamine-hydrolysing)
MPHEVTYRKTKIGFNSPIVDWMKGPLKPFFLDTISSQSFATSSLIDPKAVAHAVRHVIDDPDAKFSDGERAWMMLTPYLWERAVLNHSGAPS